MALRLPLPPALRPSGRQLRRSAGVLLAAAVVVGSIALLPDPSATTTIAETSQLQPVDGADLLADNGRRFAWRRDQAPRPGTGRTVDPIVNPSPSPTPARLVPPTAAPTTAPTPTPVRTPKATPKPTPRPTATRAPAQPATSYTFVDEFNGSSIGPAWGRHWSPFGSTAAWDRSHSTVANGVLTIAVSRDTRGWIGDLLDTKHTFEQKYGHFEARIRFDKGDGLWPAFWVSQTPDVPHPLELDAMEVCANSIGRYAWPNDARDLHTTIHFSDGSQAYNDHTAAGDLSGGWHTYAMDWRADHISFYLDGVQVWRYAGRNVPATAMPVVLNYATGGSWCGGPTNSTPGARSCRSTGSASGPDHPGPVSDPRPALTA